MHKLKAALILSNSKITMWQKEALTEALDVIDVKLVLNCQNTKAKRDYSKHLLYYVLNAISLKNNKYTRRVDYKYSGVDTINFDSIYEGNWQYIPEDISKALKDYDIDVVIKFGMGLLKVDANLQDIPILSYHHGNPSKYRGRPAGFYEIMHDEDSSGLIVQKISNKLDGGQVLAFAESKLERYSYKKTAENFYKQSRFLLKKALINLREGTECNLGSGGKNYKLPSNKKVLQFSHLIFKNKVERVKYGALYEKKWKVGLAKYNINLRGKNTIDASLIKSLPIKDEYNFYADPFFSNDGSKIRLEALGNKSGLGDIIEIDTDNLDQQSVLLTGQHYSYPFSFLLNGSEYLLPEVASHSEQYYLNIKNSKEKVYLKGLEGKRIVDATLLDHQGTYYLFFGEASSAATMLQLWVSSSIDGMFEKHPSSPVCLSPSAARMGGRIYEINGSLFRFGQNNERGYGESITISEITHLTPEYYEERVCGSINIEGHLGPHSVGINADKGLILIDYYDDKFSLLSGVRRLKAKLSRV